MRHLLIAWLLGACAGVAVALPRPAPVFSLDRTEVALGESVQLQLRRAHDARMPALDTLDLSRLEQDFDILERTRGGDATHETLALTLYARRAGRFGLEIPGWPLRSARVMVSDGSERITRVRWQVSLDEVEPLLRQPATLTVEACDDGTLLWQRPALPSMEGLSLQPLNETEIITTRDGVRCTAHRWHWVLLPTAAGSRSVTLPVFEAGKFGQRLRFYPPGFALRVRPLPDWLPQEVAVGTAEIRAEPLSMQASLEQPLPWRLHVKGAFSAAALQSLLQSQLRLADPRLGLMRHEPLIELQPSQEAVAQHRVTLFLVPSERGRFALPAMQVPWYDPAGGLLQQVRTDGQAIEVVDPMRQRVLAWALGLGALGLAVGVGAVLWRLLAWRVRRWRALHRVLRASDAQGLHEAVLAFTLRSCPLPAPTLRLWQERMARECNVAPTDDLLVALERDRYGIADAGDLEELRTLFRAWALHVRPASRAPAHS